MLGSKHCRFVVFSCWAFLCCRIVRFSAFFDAQFPSCRGEGEGMKNCYSGVVRKHFQTFSVQTFTFSANIFKHSPSVQIFSNIHLQCKHFLTFNFGANIFKHSPSVQTFSNIHLWCKCFQTFNFSTNVFIHSFATGSYAKRSPCTKGKFE